MEDWQVIRKRRLVDGDGIKPLSRETKFARNTIRKYTRSSSPPKRSGAPTRTPSMAPYEGEVDALLEKEPKITSVRIGQILRESHAGFALCERAVRTYVARRRRLLHPKEVFIRQVYVPGDQTQYDFKDVTAVVDGVESKLHLFTARLSYSTAWFGHCYRTEDRPALFDGLLRAGVEFGGVTKDGVFDNASTAVDKIHRGRRRTMNGEFAAFVGSLALNMQFAAPGKGNEKGGVEGAHGYVEDNFFRPMPVVGSLEEINAGLLALSRSEREHRVVDGMTVAQRLEIECKVLRPLAAVLPRPCVHEHVRVNKFSEVRCKTNRYSVPSRFVGRPATIELFADRLRIIVDDELAAEKPRLFGRNGASLDPLHYLDALWHKHRAVERAEVFNNAQVPQALRDLLQRLVRRDRDTAGKQFLRVVELLKVHRMSDVVAAIERAKEHDVDDPAAIGLLLVQRSPEVPAPLALDALPASAQIEAPKVRLDGYIVAELKEVA
jgi:transposase